MAYKTNPPGIRGGNLRVASVRGYGNKGTYFNPICSQNLASFNPAIAPGLVAWWDFSDAAYLYTDSGTTLVSSNGDVVGQINDKSGNGHHLRQTDGTKKGTYRTNQLNGYPVVRFDGTNDNYGCISSEATFQFLHQSVNTVYIVVKPGLVADPNALMVLIDNLLLAGSVGNRFGVSFRWDDRAASSRNEAVSWTSRLGGSGAPNNVTANAFLAAQTFGVLSFVTDPTNATAASRSAIRKNGGAATQNNTDATAVGNTAPSYVLTVGGAGGDGGFPFAGDKATTLIYNQQHGTTDRQYIENGLLSRYNIS